MVSITGLQQPCPSQDSLFSLLFPFPGSLAPVLLLHEMDETGLAELTVVVGMPADRLVSIHEFLVFDTFEVHGRS